MARISGFNYNVEVEDNSKEINDQIKEAIIAWLHEAGGVVQAQAVRNSRVDSGQLKGSWDYEVDKDKQEAYIGSPLENAIWEEFGTGEYAVNKDGRKTPWVYKDEKGKFHYTKGKKPNRTLGRAFDTTKNKITKRLQTLLKEVGK